MKQKGHKNVSYLKNQNEILKFIKNNVTSYDLLVTQGAGSVSRFVKL